AWNDSAREYGQRECLHELFEAQAEARGEAVAVVCGDEQLSYRRLNERANQLAHHLKALGVDFQQLVGLCLDPSLDMIVAVLATLKAGAAYLPLDPSYPQHRLAFMLEQAGLRVVLSRGGLEFTLPGQPPQVLSLDEQRAAIEAQPLTNPGLPASSSQLAYVIYTSGSTGQPKGVMVEHRGLANLARAQID